MGTKAGSAFQPLSEFVVTGAGTPPETHNLLSSVSLRETLMPQGCVLATAQLVATGKGSADFAVSMADINSLLPSTAKGVFHARQAWAEIYLGTGLIPGLGGRCGLAEPQVVARAAFELPADGPAAIDFSGRVTLKDGPPLSSIWTVVVQALGPFEPRVADKRALGGRLVVVGTLPLSLVVKPKR